MILHDKHHFIYNYRASIDLPDGMCIDFHPDSDIWEDGFQLIAPDKSFKLTLGFLTVEKNAQTFTEEIYDYFDSITALEPVHAIETPSGLSGYATTYALSNEICEEFAIDLPGATQALFYAHLWRLKDKEYDEITYVEAKNQIIASIREISN